MVLEKLFISLHFVGAISVQEIEGIKILLRNLLSTENSNRFLIILEDASEIIQKFM